MATPPTVILVNGPNATPFTYTLANSEAFEPRVITATFDGSAAGAAFWPCCSIYSNDGHLLGRFIPPASVPAGDTAEVTYGPF